MGAPYNGYSWEQREGILKERKSLERAGTIGPLSYLLEKGPCEVCADTVGEIEWHSEDYSPPYSFSPPATLNICAVCHLRLHKRFNQPHEWTVYLEHIKGGGYGREFVKLYPQRQRRFWIEQISQRLPVEVPTLRSRQLTGAEWWLRLTLDPESLVAPWARPRPWRQRPTTQEYKSALEKAALNAQELALLEFHARCTRRTATMRQLATHVLGNDRPQAANLAYGSLCQRLAELLKWSPDHRENGSSIWLSTIAEGWQPENREFEWVMVPSLQVLFV